jgi:HSP20 family protein
MTLIRRSSPFGELLSLRRAMDRLFDETVFQPIAAIGPESGLTMPVDIYTTPDALVIEAALPGVKPEEVEITTLGDTLSLTARTGTARTSREGGYQVQEVRRGTFTRTIGLPAGLRTEAAAATFENGLLRLSIPRAEQAQARQIPVTVVEAASQVEAASPAEVEATDAASRAGFEATADATPATPVSDGSQVN